MFLSFSFFISAQESYGTSNNIFLDSDQDGLTDEEERMYGTDSRNRDTDNDGYSDGAEVKSGYDPKKPAPGDRILVYSSENTETVSSDEDNLTQKVAEKITALTGASDSEEQEVSLEEIKSMVSESLEGNTEEIKLPEIDKDDINIKKQNYSGLSDEKAKEKKKEDFADYITAVFYIMSSNSPKPITSASDITSISADITQEIINSISARNTENLNDLEAASEKMFEELKEVEVPEELVDIHIKAMSFALYGKEIKSFIPSQGEDPLADIANFSKMNAFIGTLMDFATETQKKFAEYDINYEEDLKGRMEDMGLDVTVNQEIIDALSQ